MEKKVKTEKKSSIGIIAIVIAVLVLIVGIIVLQKKKDARPFNHIEVPLTIVVENATDYDKADTISMYIANRIFDIDTLNLMIVYIPEHLNEGEMELYGIVQHIPFKKNQFIILLNRKNISLSKLKEILSHEFVHISQYISGDLVVYPNYAVWKGEDIYFGEVAYKDRPFEKEAFKYQGGVMSKLNKMLYE